jgi:hypothetical protein
MPGNASYGESSGSLSARADRAAGENDPRACGSLCCQVRWFAGSREVSAFLRAVSSTGDAASRQTVRTMHRRSCRRYARAFAQFTAGPLLPMNPFNLISWDAKICALCHSTKVREHPLKDAGILLPIGVPEPPLLPGEQIARGVRPGAASSRRRRGRTSTIRPVASSRCSHKPHRP